MIPIQKKLEVKPVLCYRETVRKTAKKNDLENDWTKGTMSYPLTRVKSFQMLNDFKMYGKENVPPPVTGIAFSQASSEYKNKYQKSKSTGWEKSHKGTHCIMCKKGGVTWKNCTDCSKKKGEEETSVSKKKSSNEKGVKKKTLTFPEISHTQTEEMRSDDEDDDHTQNGFGAFQVQFTQNNLEIDLTECVLLDTQRTIHSF